MTPTVEPCARTEVDQVVLEFGSDGSRESAGIVEGDGDDISLALYDGFGHRSFGRKVS
jgi:hypothetical protein